MWDQVKWPSRKRHCVTAIVCVKLWGIIGGFLTWLKLDKNVVIMGRSKVGLTFSNPQRISLT